MNLTTFTVLFGSSRDVPKVRCTGEIYAFQRALSTKAAMQRAMRGRVNVPGALNVVCYVL